jgi:hypothetical protein
MQTAICSESTKPNASLEPILDQLKDASAVEEYQQLTSAIASSEALVQDLNNLSESGKFTGFIVKSKTQIQDGRVGIFGGFTNGSKIILTTELLKELKKSRLFDVVYPDDIAPNNTVFALAHLLYHIKTPIDGRKYSSPDSFADASIQIEAAAFIQSWNTMLQVAEHANGGKTLSMRPFGQLLMNTRYRFVFLKALKQTPNPLKFSSSGALEQDANNIQAIVAVLNTSSHADLE